MNFFALQSTLCLPLRLTMLFFPKIHSFGIVQLMNMKHKLVHGAAEKVLHNKE
jgi:hypothetical protein